MVAPHGARWAGEGLAMGDAADAPCPTLDASRGACLAAPRRGPAGLEPLENKSTAPPK